MTPKSKIELREQLLRLEAERSETDVASATKAVMKFLSGMKELATKKQVLLYVPVTRWHEIDITSLPRYFSHMDIDVLENTKNAAFPLKRYDVIFIPLFGFNENGYRLGRGGGWYDRFLATQPQALKIGVGYEDGLVEFTPDLHDVRLDVIVTEKSLRVIDNVYTS